MSTLNAPAAYSTVRFDVDDRPPASADDAEPAVRSSIVSAPSAISIDGSDIGTFRPAIRIRRRSRLEKRRHVPAAGIALETDGGLIHLYLIDDEASAR